jgi:hypothetical protein
MLFPKNNTPRLLRSHRRHERFRDFGRQDGGQANN